MFHRVTMNRIDQPTRGHRCAFTLVELLVVISIIVLLISLSVPSLQHAKKEGERVECSTNLSQMGRAMHAVTVDTNGYLPGPSWYGQTAIYNRNTKDLARWLATYMGYGQPRSDVQVNRSFICPSFYRVAPAGVSHERSVIYGALSERNSKGLRVFGYPAFNGEPEYGPDRLIAVKNPETAGAVRDIDVVSNGTAGWHDRTARVPIHGFDGSKAVRNYLFFDTHVETVTEYQF